MNSGNISGVHQTTSSSSMHPSYLISGQNALKRTSSTTAATATANTPILRSSAPTTYLPAPSSGSGIPELASIMNNNNNNNKREIATADASPISHRSSITSVGSPQIIGKISRNVAGLLSPRVNPKSPRINPNMRRTVSVDDTSGEVLPLISQNGNNNYNNNYNNNHHNNVDRAPQKPSRGSIMRAAESGKGSLLPTRGKPVASSNPMAVVRPKRIPKREAPGRSKSSGPSYSAVTLPRTRQDITRGGDGSSSPQISVKSKLAYLRRRTATASDDEFDLASQKVRREFNYRSSGGGGNRRSSAVSVGSTGSGGTTGRDYSNPRRSTGIRGMQNKFMMKLSRLKLGHVLQVVIVVAVMALVYESHNKALFATSQLIKFKEEESLLLLHLQKIEQQSIQLHENIGRLARAGIRGDEGDSTARVDNNNGDETAAIGGGGDGTGRDVDFDLIHKQTQQLYQMEEELDHEVKTLQSRIQLSARNHIIQEFGEGPVQVVLELDFGSSQDNAGPHRISILLWHDTPHAAWTWLEQIGNNSWDGAEFQWQKGHIIDAVPIRSDPENGKIQFLEHSQHAHQAWTIGVRESDKDSLGMYINLQDNSDLHKHETCVGKVIDGFDALQRLLEAARGEQDSSIAIRKATAMHYVTKKAGI